MEEAGPRRSVCRGCGQPVLLVELGAALVFAEVREWEPLMPCRVCRSVMGRGFSRVHCSRCKGTGWLGQQRPAVRMLAINVAWEKTYAVRYVEPYARLRRGEAAHALHLCAPALAAA
jgi:hypothetical protein